MTPTLPTPPKRTPAVRPRSFRFGAVLKLLAVAALAGTATLAAAQGRPLPDDSKRGVMRHFQEMLVSVDGTTLRLAAGGHIRDRNNMIIVPTALPPGGALADYVLDMNGQISRAWLLTEEEARRPKKKPAGN